MTRGYAGWGLNLGFYSPGYYFDFAYSTPYNNYYNPYCEPVGFYPVQQPSYNYSQPLNGQEEPGDEGVNAMALADDAFRIGDYRTALANVDKAAQAIPNNSEVHHFRSLVLFAMKNYREAAAAAHAALTAGRGWNWEVIRSFYPSKEAYTAQLRALEAYRRENSTDAASRFLLGYHYMMLGHSEAAAKEFVAELQLEPRDTLARELLKSISEKTGKQYPVPAAGTNGVPPTSEKPKKEAPHLPPIPPLPMRKGKSSAKLSGSWTATAADGTAVTLSLLDGGKFRWAATRDGRTTRLEGTYSLAGDKLRLKASKTGQVLEGQLTQGDKQAFGLKLKWLGADESELKFQQKPQKP